MPLEELVSATEGYSGAEVSRLGMKVGKVPHCDCNALK